MAYEAERAARADWHVQGALCRLTGLGQSNQLSSMLCLWRCYCVACAVEAEGRHYITCPTRMHAESGVSTVQVDQPALPQPAEQPSQQHAWGGALPAAAGAVPLPQWHPEAGGKLWAFVEGFRYLRSNGKSISKGKICVPRLSSFNQLYTIAYRDWG